MRKGVVVLLAQLLTAPIVMSESVDVSQDLDYIKKYYCKNETLINDLNEELANNEAVLKDQRFIEKYLSISISNVSINDGETIFFLGTKEVSDYYVNYALVPINEDFKPSFTCNEIDKPNVVDQCNAHLNDEWYIKYETLYWQKSDDTTISQ